MSWRATRASSGPTWPRSCATADVEEVTVVGLATDYCVKETASDALREGFRVTIDRGGIRGIDVEPGDSERALDELRAAGAEVS